MIAISQMRKLSLREEKYFAQSHPTSEWESRHLAPLPCPQPVSPLITHLTFAHALTPMESQSNREKRRRDFRNESNVEKRSWKGEERCKGTNVVSRLGGFSGRPCTSVFSSCLLRLHHQAVGFHGRAPRAQEAPKPEAGDRPVKAPAAPNEFRPLGPASHPRERANEARSSCGSCATWQALEGFTSRKGSEVAFANHREGKSRCRLRKFLQR